MTNQTSTENNEKCIEFMIKHYEQVSIQLKDYYTLYMQSWTIFGSAILVGSIFFLGKLGQATHENTFVQMLLGVTPLILLIWFLLTSHFWAMFKMYRQYLKELEKGIAKLLSGNCKCAYPDLHGDDCYYVGNGKAKFAEALVLVLCTIIFGLVALQAAKIVDGKTIELPYLSFSPALSFEGMSLFYFIMALISGGVAFLFVKQPYKNKLESNKCVQSVTTLRNRRWQMASEKSCRGQGNDEEALSRTRLPR